QSGMAVRGLDLQGGAGAARRDRERDHARPGGVPARCVRSGRARRDPGRRRPALFHRPASRTGEQPELMAHGWNAATYDPVANDPTGWGGNVVSWLTLKGDERVLDAGCGSGRVTAQLLERLPHGHVVALDGSAGMLVEARRRLASEADRVELVQA